MPNRIGACIGPCFQLARCRGAFQPAWVLDRGLKLASIGTISCVEDWLKSLYLSLFERVEVSSFDLPFSGREARRRIVSLRNSWTTHTHPTITNLRSQTSDVICRYGDQGKLSARSPNRYVRSSVQSTFNPCLSLFPASLKKILNLNETVESSEADEAHANGLLAPVAPILDSDGNPIWKVLVFDDLGRDVISSVMRVSDLRSMGVTMHM